MEITLIISGFAALVAGLSYLNSRRSTANQEAGLKLQFTQHEERQKESSAARFNKLAEDITRLEADKDKRHEMIEFRLAGIEKKISTVEEMHTQIELIKQNSLHTMKVVEAIQEHLSKLSSISQRSKTIR
jgi:hypothetical protein